MVKITATGFGTTALKSGQIIHFDPDEAKKPAAQRDKRKLEADVDADDAKRIVELGWGKYADKADADSQAEGERAELGEAVQMAEETPKPEPGKPSQVAPRADRDDPAANAYRLANDGRQPRAPRPSEKAKAAAKAAAKSSGKAPAAPAPTPVPTPAEQTGDGQKQEQQQEGSGDNGDDDPEAGPKT